MKKWIILSFFTFKPDSFTRNYPAQSRNSFPICAPAFSQRTRRSPLKTRFLCAGAVRALLIPAAIALLAACAPPLSGNGEGNLRIVLAGRTPSGARTVIDPPEDVSYYRLDFTGPGGEPRQETLYSETSLTLTLSLGQWTIRAEARTEKGTLRGSGETTVDVEAGGTNEAKIVMKVTSRPPGFTIEGPQDETIAITMTHNAGAEPATDISWSGDESITFTIDGSGYAVENENVKWFVNGTELSAAGNSLVIRARDYVRRSYTLTALIKADGQWYSTEIPFEVTE